METKRRTVATQSTLITLSSESQEKEGKRILLKIQDDGNEAGQFYYLIDRKKKFRELMIDYTERIGVSMHSVAFHSDGRCIGSFDTAEFWELENEDSIDVIRGGHYSLRVLHSAKGDAEIFLNVGSRDHKFFYLIGRNTPLRHLMLDYCNRTGEDFDYVIFKFSEKIIDPRKTAQDLEIEDHSYIEVKELTHLGKVLI